jgi:cytochrome oxidase assembly protein ShyY1
MTFPALLLQPLSAEDVAIEINRVKHSYDFLWYGLSAAWIILVIYLLMMVNRERKLRREIDGLKAMLEEKPH